jgi:ABC-type bacteriocin/lantibiotic exporter with double-glycine peptidase domain
MVAIAGCLGRPLASKYLSSEAVVLDLPIVKATDIYACGMSCFMVLSRYYGIPVPDDLTQRAKVAAKDHKGLSGQEMKSFLEEIGFEVFVFRGTLDDTPTGLFHHLDRARPLIVMTSDGRNRNHYEVVMGFDKPRNNIVLLDPNKGCVIVPKTVFQQNWEIAEGFTLLATLPDATVASDGRIENSPRVQQKEDRQ